MSLLPPVRVPRGVPGGGQFAAGHHPEPAVSLGAPAQPWTEEDGKRIALELDRLSRPRVSAKNFAVADIMREASSAHTGEDLDESVTVPRARRELEDLLARLGLERTGHWSATRCALRSGTGMTPSTSRIRTGTGSCSWTHTITTT
jgi:hypothetical protein